MALSFSSSMRSLADDKFSPSFLIGGVSVYEISDLCRIEIDTSLYPIAVPVSGTGEAKQDKETLKHFKENRNTVRDFYLT